MIKTVEKIVCDFCGVTGGDADRLTEARRGWVSFRDKDICPNCRNILVGKKERKEIVPERMTDKELAATLLEESDWAAENSWDVPIMLPDELKEAAKRIDNRGMHIIWFATQTTPPKEGTDVLFNVLPNTYFVGRRTNGNKYTVSWDGTPVHGVPDFWIPIL